jgi:hypothetical protein
LGRFFAQQAENNVSARFSRLNSSHGTADRTAFLGN